VRRRAGGEGPPAGERPVPGAKKGKDLHVDALGLIRPAIKYWAGYAGWRSAYRWRPYRGAERRERVTETTAGKSAEEGICK